MAVRVRAATTVSLAAVGIWAVFSVANSDGPKDPEVHARVDGPVLTSDAMWDVGMLALVRGRIQLVDGCLRLGGAAVIWPTGTTWDEAANAVRLRDGRLVALGATVSGGGGWLAVDEIAETFNDELADAVRACDSTADPGAEVFNAGGVLSTIPKGAASSP